MIILDWNKNSEEVLAQGHYNTKRSVNTEQTRLCQYWQEQGVDKDEAFKVWVSLESPQVVGSLNEEERWEYFNYFWVRAKHYGFNKKYKYGTTLKEYEFIENLDISIEYKVLLQNLIEYCATYGKGNRFSCSKEIWKGILRGNRDETPTRLLCKLTEINGKYDLFQATPYSKDGKEYYGVVLNFFDISNDPRYCLLFSTDNKTCAKCGKRYHASSRSQTSLCPLCYREDLARRKNKK